MGRRWVYLIIVFFSAEQLSAQIVISGNLPVSVVPQSNLIYYSDILSYINPAAPRLKNKFTFNSKIASYSGIRKDLKEYYFDSWYKFKKEDKLAIGVQFYGNNQGSFIKLQTGKLNTRYTIELSENWKVNTAIGLGFISYAFEGNDFIAGGADIVPDIDAGISLQSEKWNIGISRMHLINNRLQPILATFSKNRLLNFNLGRKFSVGSELTLNALAVSSYNLSISQLENDFTLETIYKNKLKLITLLYHTNIVGVGGGLQDLDTAIGKFALNFVYSVGLSRINSVSSNRYEIGFSYKID